MSRGYPKDLASVVRERWPADAHPLPARLDAILDVAYHASFCATRAARRSSHPRFAHALAGGRGAADRALPLPFERTVLVRRARAAKATPAADVHRVHRGGRGVGDLVVWGIVQTGPLASTWRRVAVRGAGGAVAHDPHRSPRSSAGRLGARSSRSSAAASPPRCIDVQAEVDAVRFRDARALMASEHHEVPSDRSITTRPAPSRGIGAADVEAHRGDDAVGAPRRHHRRRAPNCLDEQHLFARHAFADEGGRRRFRGLRPPRSSRSLARQCKECGRSRGVSIARVST